MVSVHICFYLVHNMFFTRLSPTPKQQQISTDVVNLFRKRKIGRRMNDFFKHRRRLTQLASRWKRTDIGGTGGGGGGGQSGQYGFIPSQQEINDALSHYTGNGMTAIYRNFPADGFRSLDPHSVNSDKPLLDGTNARLTRRLLTRVRHRKALELPPYAMTGDYVFYYRGGIPTSATDKNVCTLMGVPAINYELFSNYETAKMSSSTIAQYVGDAFGVLWYTVDLPGAIAANGAIVSVLDDYKTAVVTYGRRARIRNYWCSSVVPLHLRVTSKCEVGHTLWLVLQKVEDAVYTTEQETRQQVMAQQQQLKHHKLSSEHMSSTSMDQNRQSVSAQTVSSSSSSSSTTTAKTTPIASIHADFKHSKPTSAVSTPTTPAKTAGIHTSARKRKHKTSEQVKEQELLDDVINMIAEHDATQRELEEMLTRNQPKTGSYSASKAASVPVSIPPPTPLVFPVFSASTSTSTATQTSMLMPNNTTSALQLALRDTYQIVEANGRVMRPGNRIWQLVPYVTMNGTPPYVVGHMAAGFKPTILRVGKVLNVDTIPTTPEMDEHTFPITPEWNKYANTLSAIDVLLDPAVF